MPHLDHRQWHNIYIYDSENHDRKLGGLWAGESFTNAYLYSMVETICLFTDTFTLNNATGKLVRRDGQNLQTGKYYVVTDGKSLVCFGHSKLIASYRNNHRN